MTELTDKVERSIARFERVDPSRSTNATGRPAPRRGRERAARLNCRARTDLSTSCCMRSSRSGLATVVIGLVKPIGIFGFLAAAAHFRDSHRRGLPHRARRTPSDRYARRHPRILPNGPMVDRFDSYVFRVRRSLAQRPRKRELDAISQLLPSLKQTLGRLDTLDPSAQDARRLMSIHLPGLIDRYQRVPPAYRQESDGEGKTVDQRLVEGLAAGRAALAEVAEQLARADVAALETQGRIHRDPRYGRTAFGRTDDPADASVHPCIGR